jgi:Fanconi-associated nuclease 1
MDIARVEPREEAHLFNEAEREVFRHWQELPYEVMNHLVFRVPLKHANKSFYLPFRLCRYVRLFLRKTAAWHRISKLGYYPGIADLPRAVDDLRRARSLPGSSTGTTDNPVQSAFPEDVLGSSTAFAEGIEEITTLEEASPLLLLEELKELAKEVKISHKNKKELLAALRQSSQTQAGLGRNITNGKLQSQIENRDAHFLRKILDHTGDCIRLSSAPLKLFERVHLVFYGSTEKSLTTIILAKISRKNFPDYVVSQSTAIFSSRDALLEFEAALRTQFQVDSLLESNGAPTPERLQAVKDLCERVYLSSMERAGTTKGRTCLSKRRRGLPASFLSSLGLYPYHSQRVAFSRSFQGTQTGA